MKRLSSLHCVFLVPLSKIICPHTCGFISECLFLFHWPVCPFFCQYHGVLITVVLKYNLKSGSVIPLGLFFFLRIALAFQGLLWFYTNLMIFCSICLKNVIGILMGIALNLYIALGNMDILTMLILPIHEYGLSSHFIIFS